MKATGISLYTLVGLLLLFIYLGYLVVEPFLSYLLFSLVFVMLFDRVNKWLYKKTKRRRLSSSILVVAVILLLVLPSIFVTSSLISQAPEAYDTFVSRVNTAFVENVILRVTGKEVDVSAFLAETSTRFSEYIVNNAGGVLSSATDVFIGLFVMFFTMFYLFSDGRTLLAQLRKLLPISQKHQQKLIEEISSVVRGLIEGQLVLGIIQGVVGGVTLALLGVGGALFWGFVMIIASIIPFLGAFIVWVPVAIWLFLTGSVVNAIILAIVGTFILSQIDNFLRPYIVSSRADIHPALVLVGVLGGLKVFGFVGFIVGPLILAILTVVVRFHQQDL